MDLTLRKYKFIEQFMKIVNAEQLDKLEQFFKKEIVDNSIENLPKEIQEMLKKSEYDIENSNLHSHLDVLKEMKAAYKN